MTFEILKEIERAVIALDDAKIRDNHGEGITTDLREVIGNTRRVG